MFLTGLWLGLSFLSTLSLRRATRCCTPLAHTAAISIHALLAESDRFLRLYEGIDRYFYPRSLCVERPEGNNNSFFRQKISIHALLAESDSPKSEIFGTPSKISIHALLAESDSRLSWQSCRA